MSDKWAATRTESEFWRAVRELAAMRSRIPEERRALSGVRHVMQRDVLPKRGY